MLTNLIRMIMAVAVKELAQGTVNVVKNRHSRREIHQYHKTPSHHPMDQQYMYLPDRPTNMGFSSVPYYHPEYGTFYMDNDGVMHIISTTGTHNNSYDHRHNQR